MNATERQHRLLDTLVTLADTLVAEYDIADLLQLLVERSAELVDASAAGILIEREGGGLEVIASSDERAQVLEVLQLAADTGPCIECFRTGLPVTLTDIEAERSWPQFRGAALGHGFRSLHAVPLRLRDTTIGSMNLFLAHPGEIDQEQSRATRALADVATIGILQQRAIREADVARTQLQRALDTRVIIEQAKGVIAYTRDVEMGVAFELLRGYARSHSLGIGAVAERVVDRTLVI